MSATDSLHLQTRRLWLRPFGPADTALVARILRNPRVAFWRKKRIPLTEVREGIVNSIRLNRWALGWWLIFEKETNELVGSVMLQPLKNTSQIEIGYHLLPHQWGQGYGSEVAAQIVSHAFETIGLSSIRAVVLPRNRPSLHIVKKLGFAQRGILFHANLLHRYFKLEQQDYIVARSRPNQPKSPHHEEDHQRTGCART